MFGSFRTIVGIMVGFILLLFVIGCAQDERREVKMTEERHEGEVEPTSPGEMVVE